MINGRNVRRRVGEQLQAVAQHAERADLVDDGHHQHRGRRGGLDGGVGQPAVERPQRRLDREGEHEAEEQRVEHGGIDAELTVRDRGDDGPEVERARLERVAVGGHHVQPDHRGQHDQAAEQVVQQELHRRLGPRARAAEPADEEVHRDQHRLEEHVEQQDVERDQRDQHHALDGQDQREVGVRRAGLVAAVVPAGDDQQRHQHGGQHHQRQRDAVERRGCSRCRTTESTAWSSTNWYCAPAGSNSTASSDGDRQHHQRERQARRTSRGVVRPTGSRITTRRARPSGRPTGRSTTACRSPDPHHQDRGDHQRGAGEHRQRVGAGEPGLQPPQPFRRRADDARRARGTTPSMPSSSISTRPAVSVLTGPHEDVLVERVAVEVVAGRDGQRRDVLRRGLGDRPGGVHRGRRCRHRPRPPRA